METKGLISAVIANKDRKEDLIKCIKSIKANTYKKVEIIVADNGSTDGSREAVKKLFPEVILLENKLNLGAVMAVNNCIRKAKGEFILRMDNDVIIEKDVIEKLLKVLKNNPKVGATTGLQFYTEEPNVLRGTEMKVNLFIGKTKFYNRDKEYHEEFEKKFLEIEAVSACVLLARKSVWEEIGFLEENYFLAYDDVDWCLRLRKAGYKIIIIGSAKVYHKKGGGMAQKDNPFRIYLTERDRILFMKKHANWKKLVFIPYLFLFLYPAKTFIFLTKFHPKSIKALTRSFFDGLFNKKTFIYTSDEKSVNYQKKEHEN
jgi:GT2 family glycosyltransferase